MEKLTCDKMIGLDLNNYDIDVLGENPSISAIDDIYCTEIENISNISDKEYLLTIHLDSVCGVDSFLLKSEWSIINKEDLINVEIENSDWNEYYVLLKTQIGLQIDIDIIYNIEKKKFLSFEISDINDYNCLFC